MSLEHIRFFFNFEPSTQFFPKTRFLLISGHTLSFFSRIPFPCGSDSMRWLTVLHHASFGAYLAQIAHFPMGPWTVKQFRNHTYHICRPFPFDIHIAPQWRLKSFRCSLPPWYPSLLLFQQSLSHFNWVRSLSPLFFPQFHIDSGKRSSPFLPRDGK